MSQTCGRYHLCVKIPENWWIVTLICAKITGTHVPSFTSALSHSYSKSKSTAILCTYSAFTYDFNSFVTKTLESRYMLSHTACSNMNALTLPFISLHFFLFSVSPFILSSFSHFLSLSHGRTAEKEWVVRCMFNLCSGPVVPRKACHLLALCTCICGVCTQR